MKLKKMLAVVLFLSMGATMLSGCSKSQSDGSAPATEENKDAAQTDKQNADNGESYTFQIGHVVTSDHAYHLGLQKFAEIAEEKSNGRLKFEIFPSSQLGNERDLVEGLTMGTIDMALSNSGNMATFIDSYQVFDLPFLFRDYEHARKVLDSEIGQEALDSLETIGIKGLSNWENGFFCTWNSKRAINGPEDFKGLKIRANDNPIHISAYEALGVPAITMGWSEVYTAVQNGTVDGVSVTISSMYTAKMYEVAPYISDSGEFYVTVILMMSKQIWDTLPSDLQQIMLDAAEEAKDYERELNENQEKEAMKFLEENGYTITHPDKAALKAVCWQPVYDKYAEQLGKEKIDSIINDY